MGDARKAARERVQARTAARKAAGLIPDYSLPRPATSPRGDCAHRGEEPVRSVECENCRGKVQLKVFPCAVHGECTAQTRADGVAGCCRGCGDHSAGNDA